jgi:hypothetical protein
VLASWIAGDAMKMMWFFTATSEIPIAFKLCGIFQACCDSYLGIQYYMYGEGDVNGHVHPHSHPHTLRPSGSRSPSALHIPMLEKSEQRLD